MIVQQFGKVCNRKRILSKGTENEAAIKGAKYE